MQQIAPLRRQDELTLSERFVLWSLRTLIARERGNPCAEAAFRRGLAQAQVPEAGAALAITIRMIAAGARRVVDVRCSHHQELSEDEDRLLTVVAAAQAEAHDIVGIGLAELIMPGTIAFTAIAVREFAAILSGAKLELPAPARDAFADHRTASDAAASRRLH